MKIEKKNTMFAYQLTPTFFWTTITLVKCFNSDSKYPLFHLLLSQIGLWHHHFLYKLKLLNMDEFSEILVDIESKTFRKYRFKLSLDKHMKIPETVQMLLPFFSPALPSLCMIESSSNHLDSILTKHRNDFLVYHWNLWVLKPLAWIANHINYIDNIN